MICIISSIVGYGQIQKIQIQKQFATRRLVQAKKLESEAREATVTERDQRTGSKIYNWKNKPKALTQTCRLDVGLQTTSYSPFAETMRLSLPLSRYSELFVESRIFPPRVFGAAVGVTPLKFHQYC